MDSDFPVSIFKLLKAICFTDFILYHNVIFLQDSTEDQVACLIEQ